MNDVTPIVIFVCALAGVVAVVTGVASHRRKKRIRAERERKAMERRVAARLAEEREARQKKAVPFVAPAPRARQAKPTRTVPLRRSARTNTYRPQPRPAQQDPSVDSLNNMLMAGLLFNEMNNHQHQTDSSPSPTYDTPTPSPSYDSGSTSSSYDGGSSSSSFDGGSSGSFSGGDSGSF